MGGIPLFVSSKISPSFVQSEKPETSTADKIITRADLKNVSATGLFLIGSKIHSHRIYTIPQTGWLGTVFEYMAEMSITP